MADIGLEFSYKIYGGFWQGCYKRSIMKQTIVDLRRVMQREGIDAWISPSSDAHQSEYPTEYDKCRRFLSGFTEVPVHFL